MVTLFRSRPIHLCWYEEVCLNVLVYSVAVFSVQIVICSSIGRHTRIKGVGRSLNALGLHTLDATRSIV